MNLNELWSGNDYAYFEMKGRNEHYRSNAPRVKIIRIYKKKASYENERLSGYAEVLMCDRETGEPRVRSDGSHVTKEVRARDIAMRWDEYEQEEAHRAAQRAQVAREQEERAAKETAQRIRIKELLISKYGIPEAAISSVGEYVVTLKRPTLEQELEVG